MLLLSNFKSFCGSSSMMLKHRYWIFIVISNSKSKPLIRSEILLREKWLQNWPITSIEIERRRNNNATNKPSEEFHTKPLKRIRDGPKNTLFNSNGLESDFRQRGRTHSSIMDQALSSV